MQSKLMPTELQQGEFALLTWVVTPEIGTTIETVLKPEYWSHVAKSLKPWHRIEVRDPGFGWIAYLRVKDAGAQWANVHLEGIVELARKAAPAVPPLEMPDTSDFEIKWRGPVARWSIIRVVDKVTMVENIKHKDEAIVWLRSYLAKVAA